VSGPTRRVAPLVAAALALLATAPAARGASSCDLSDLDGTYSFVVHGTNPAGQPFAAGGTVVADGAGGIDGVRVSVDDGVYGSAEFTCTYVMSSDCRFRGPCVDDGEAIAEVQIDGALADNGRELLLVLSSLPSGPGGAVVSGQARRQ
jgi:hypothetical protein